MSQHSGLSVPAAHLPLIVETLAGTEFGISIFDIAHTLAYANAAYYRLLDLTPQQVPFGTPLADIFKILSERGEFRGGHPDDLAEAQLQRIKSGTMHVFRRARPNGRWLEIHSRPLDGGAFARMYRDVTELIERQWQRDSALRDLKRQVQILEQELRVLKGR